MNEHIQQFKKFQPLETEVIMYTRREKGHSRKKLKYKNYFQGA